MQLAISFMQLAAAGRRRTILHFHCVFFFKKNVIGALEWR